MAYKIEIGTLGITNYPIIAKHFKDMAAKGWLIDKIISDNFFIYKNIKPEELDFSITPYETEKIFARKSKEELEEFKTVCQRVGWNYAAKTKDFHIYFKARGEEAVDLETDDEEELSSLEEIANKQFRVIYFLIPLFALFLFRILQDISIGFYTFKEIFNPVQILKSGLIQLSILLLPIFIISFVKKIYRNNKFIKKNKENIELGKSIKYSNSKFYLEKIEIVLSIVLILFAVIQIIYSLIITKDNSVYRFLIPYAIANILVLIFNKTIKPAKKSFDYKVFSFIAAGILAVTISVVIGRGFDDEIESQGKINTSNLAIITPEDINLKGVKELEKFSKDFSIFIPKSYQYSTFTEDGKYMETDYTKALTQPIAEYIVKKYRDNQEEYVKSMYKEEVRYAIEKDDYNANFQRDAETPENLIEEVDLEQYGLTEEEFNKLDKKDPKLALEEAMKIMEAKNIIEGNKNLWNADEVYFLSNNKDKIVIRQGKEVFMLEGPDFSDQKVIQIVKEKLEL